ncbi:MAG TPA: hypothetical protein VKZ82_08885 [Nonomuraea sp.]|nr:hypothetical protein [Nonomuraea sp.]
MTSVFSFAEDLRGEGLATVLDRVQATGADSLTLAASYHQSRDVFPHNPHGVTQYLSSGSSAFRPTTERYGLLHPAPGDGRRDLLADLVDATTARGMTAQAWVVLLHNSRLGRAHPEVTVHNALGDRLRHALCPAHPEVRRYVTALATDLAEHGVTAIHLEALTAGGYDHGETHERALIYLGETARFLLGLCFCPHCRAAGHAQDVDVDVLAARIHGVLTEVLQSHDYAAALPPLTPDTLGELLGEPILAYLAARTRTVTTLAAEVATTVHAVSAQTRVVLLDPSGAALGYATGRPETSASATSLAWREGLDLADLSEHVDIGALCYFADPDRMRQEIVTYSSTLRPGGRLAAVLRPTWPDATSADTLSANVRAARDAGVSDLHFYTYGLVRLESLDWLRRSLAI